jgi:hypothetical protein
MMTVSTQLNYLVNFALVQIMQDGEKGNEIDFSVKSCIYVTTVLQKRIILASQR